MMKYVTSQSHMKDTTSGFTLVETLVAITILLLVIIGPVSIAARGLQMSYQSGNELTAIFLAQEAMESVVRLRDQQALAVLAGSGANNCGGGTAPQGDENCTRYWIHEDTSPARSCRTGTDFSGNGCNLTSGGAYQACEGADSCHMTLSNGQYVNTTQGTNGVFRRVVKLAPFATTGAGGRQDSVSVQVEVSWSSGLFGTRSVTLQTYLYDHYDRFQY